MKKHMLSTLSAACAAVMSICALGTTPASAANTKIMGDLTNDLLIDAKDATEALRIYNYQLLEITDAAVNADNCPADIDMNGEINAKDANSILRYYAETLVGGQPLWADMRQTSYVDRISTDVDANPFRLTGMYIEIGCASGAPGEEVTVPLYVAGLNGLAGFQYTQITPDGLALTKIISHTDELEDEEIGVNNPAAGALVWTTLDGLDIEIKDGFLLAEFVYQIPEDAQPGENFVITADTEYNRFVTENCVFGNSNDSTYQYTMLSGVVHVE